MKTSTMDINRETAMRLWNKSFGKACKANDFSGREMIKAAYSDRHSEYGWNMDHILPQSKGGKTTESNLICCHIKTNDEKADKFPCFTANGKKFEIVKVQNHYEIKEVKSAVVSAVAENNDDGINFFDSAAGISYYKRLKGVQNKKVFVGTVVIDLCGMTTTAIVDFVKEIFYDKSFVYQTKSRRQSYYGLIIRGDSDNYFRIIIKDYDMPRKEDTTEMLDRCVLLNTYLEDFFKPQGVVAQYRIFFGLDISEEKKAAQTQVKEKMDSLCRIHELADNVDFYPLFINDLVRLNTEAKEKLQGHEASGKDSLSYPVYKYDYIYSKLSENLKKQVK